MEKHHFIFSINRLDNFWTLFGFQIDAPPSL